VLSEAQWSPSNDEIVGRLLISPPIAKSYGRNILRKLDCHDRAGLVVLAYECGLFGPPAMGPSHSRRERQRSAVDASERTRNRAPGGSGRALCLTN
jgi:hypothetical protein